MKRVLVAGILLFTGAAVVETPVSSAQSPYSELLVMFDGDLKILAPDGSVVVSIPDAIRGNISPDGSEVVYVSNGGPEGLFVADIDGNNPVQIASGSYEDPEWSPDGSQILVASYNSFPTELVIMGPDGSNVTSIPGATISSQGHGWFPDGTRVFWIGGGQGSLLHANLDGTDPVSLSTSPPVLEFEFPAISPDGTRFVVSETLLDNANMSAIDIDGSNREVLLANTYNTGRDLGAGMRWSADSSRVAFSRDGVGLEVIDVDSLSIETLLDFPLASCFISGGSLCRRVR